MSIPGSASPLFFQTAAAADTGANITKSVRFNSEDSAHLTRTPSSAGNRKTWTWSAWVKRSKLGERKALFTAGSDNTEILFEPDDKLRIYFFPSGAYAGHTKTVASFRDTSAWYHIVFAIDTTQTGNDNIAKIYVNGVEQEVTHPNNWTTNGETDVNNTVAQYIGSRYGPGRLINAYMADIYLIDGQQLDCTSFGAFDDNGVWQAAAYSGSFGTNGFHLFDFANESGVGNDSSGNDNDFTVNNIQAAASGTNYTLGTTLANGDITGWFNGIINAYMGYIRPTTLASFTNIPAASSSLRIYAWAQSANQGNFVINGSSTSISTGTTNAFGWLDLSSLCPITLTSLTTSAGSLADGFFVRAIEVDGTILVDGVAPSQVDVLFDVPTNGTQSDTGAGGEVSGNYATLNPLHKLGDVVLANGNLDVSWSGTNGHSAYSTIAIFSGKFYWEFTVSGTTSVGIYEVDSAASTWPGIGSDSYAYAPNGQKVTNSSYTNYGTAHSSGDVVGVAFDADNGKLYFSLNGTWQNSSDPENGTNPAFTGLTASAGYYAAIGYWNGGNSNSANFGQRSWAYSAPSGYKALCTTNLPTPTIADGSAHFQANLWTGSGSARSITTTGMSPDLIWIKQRSGSYHNVVFDSVRGATYRLNTNLTNAEDTGAGVGVVSSFNSDGFSLDGGGGNVNQSSGTYVGWAWDAGSSTVSNTDGSLTSTVRANTTAGMSIVTYTGNLSSAGNATVGHGLGVAPSLVITKSRSATGSWAVQHISLGTNEFMELNTTAAVANSSSIGAGALPKPTSSVFYASYITGLNINNVTFVGYCFAPVAGYSAFGKFTSNNTEDNVFLYTGFAPRYILWRITNTSGGWSIYDAARDPVNPNNTYLRANSADAEATATPGVMDFLSNGFKVRNTLGGTNSLIYMAFASNPFQANGGLAR